LEFYEASDRFGLLGLWTAFMREDYENPTSKLVIILQSPLSPTLSKLCFFHKKRKKEIGLFFSFYLRLLRNIAAAAITMMMTATDMARYVMTGIALAG
jgi:hypothetical protein